MVLTQTASRDKQAAAADLKVKLCRSLVVNGSRLPKRVCQRQREWDASEEAFVSSIGSRRALVHCEMREILTAACRTRSEGLAS
jgi:hypothetical protein